MTQFFWMHHATIDRLSVIKQRKTWEDANPGGTYQYKDHYFIDDPADPVPYGHALTDAMWPWDDGESMPAVYDPSSSLSERTLLKGTGAPSRASVSTKIG